MKSRSIRGSSPDSAAETTAIYSHANPAPLAAVRSVHGAFRALLHEEEKPLAFRLYAAARILDFHARPDMAGAVRTAR